MEMVIGPRRNILPIASVYDLPAPHLDGGCHGSCDESQDRLWLTQQD